MAQPGGRELFGAPLGVAPQLQPLQGMLLRRSTDIYPKELARDMREFFSSLLGKTCGGTMQATELLKQTPLFEGLSDADLEGLAQSTRIQDYKAGQTIVIEGRVGAAFFILVSGSVEVIKRRGQPEEAILATLEVGDFFGELATMRHVPRSASIRAVQDSTCLVIRRADFEAYISKFPNVVAKVESTLTSRFGEVPDLDD